MSRRILPMGAGALLVEVGDLDEVLALHAGMAASAPPGVIETVPAARTLLVRFDSRRIALGAVRAWAQTVGARDDASAVGAVVDVPLVYDGADLEHVAAILGIGSAALIDRHVRTPWRVAFTGFAPGFAYLVGDAWPFDVPRLATPRTRVPAGAVALAAGFTGAYPRETPGGWQLIGTTGARLFDPDAAQPALLRPGARVRFVADRPVVRVAPPPMPAVSDGEPTGFHVSHAGPLATLQDRGRPGRASDGVAVSGAADRGAAARANRLVGNAPHAAVVEILLGPFRARAHADLWIAVTGGLGPVRVDGRETDPHRAVRWPAGAELEIGPLATGLRAYLGVRGGVSARRAVGSRSTDTLAGLGPAPLAPGDEIGCGGDVAGPVPAIDAVPWTAPAGGVVELEAAPGPRADWFAPASRDALFGGLWRISAHTDRVGVRLDGPVLTRIRTDELPSEAMVPGAIQVPPAGQPVVLGVDGPVTGGYPVIAVVTPASLDRLAQARPGSLVRVRRVP